MKQIMKKVYQPLREQWLQNAVLRRMVMVSVPVLLLGVWLGGLRIAMLLTGYLQLAYRALLPGEPVENQALQRAAALAAGLARMLFFTGMMTHAVWPFLLIALVQLAALICRRIGERSGMEISLLPLLVSTGFVLLGLVFSGGIPAVGIALSGVLMLTLVDWLAHGRQNWNQLKMRFHLA